MHSAEAPTKQVATTGSANELLLLPDTTAKHDSIKYLKPIIKKSIHKKIDSTQSRTETNAINAANNNTANTLSTEKAEEKKPVDPETAKAAATSPVVTAEKKQAVQQDTKQAVTEQTKEEKKNGFFKNLFKKKKTEAADSTKN